MAKIKKKKNNSAQKSHVQKTRSEFEEYITKVRSNSPTGSTDGSEKQSDLSLGHTVISGQEDIAPSERRRVPLPQDEKPSFWKIIGWIAATITVIGVIVGFTRWITILEVKIDSNANIISKIDNDIDGFNITEMSVKERLIKLEEWRDSFSDRIEKIEIDLKNGTPLPVINQRIDILENEIEMLKKYNHGANNE